MLKFNAKQLRKISPKIPSQKIYKTPLVFVLDNVQDTYNIGSFFRLADALGVRKIYLCGETVTPPNPKIHRASVGLWRWLPWEHHRSSLSVLKLLRKEGYSIVVAEQSKESCPYLKVKPKFPVALVVGHESEGINPEILKYADLVVEIPLLGVNRSLNVLVAASVIAYHFLSLL